jgi:hypothetical protein
MNIESILIMLFSINSTLSNPCSAHGVNNKSNLTKVECAGELSKFNFSSEQESLIFAKYGLSAKAEYELINYVFKYCRDLCISEGWHCGCDDKRLGLMAVMATFEVLYPHLKPLSGREKAKFLDIEETTWRRRWQVRYKAIFSYANSLSI